MSTEIPRSVAAAGLFVATSGAIGGPPVVLVHGSMDRSAGMLRLSRRLGDRYRLTRYDRRGYGRSHDATGPFTVASHVADLARIVEQVGEPVLLFGHSFGGNLALAVAQQHPERVRAVAVYETPLSWLPWWPGNTAGALATEVGDPADAAEAFIRRLVGDAVWERLPAATRLARRAEGPAMVAELTDLRRGAPWEPSEIGCPVTALHGEHARPHHRRGTEHLASALPDATLVELADAGHGAPNSHAPSLAAALSTAWEAGGLRA